MALVAGVTAQAQTSITLGSVNGKVVDAKGAPVAAAKVIITSGQTSRTVVSGADGAFHMGLLNPGAWDVRVTKDGFQTQTAKFGVSAGESRTLNFKLASVASATVEVMATGTTLDTSSVSLGSNMSFEELASIPQARDFSGVAMFAPGVVSNGGFNTNSPSMSGASGAENTYFVDGLDTTDYRYGFQGAQLKTDFIDQVSIQTGGFAPEFSALGGVFNAITKSGSNTFAGSAWTTWDAVGLHAALKSSKYFQEPSLDTDTRLDWGAQISGPLIKDKLFYFIGFDDQTSKGQSSTQVDPVTTTDAAPKQDAYQTVFKLNWFINQDMQLTWFGNYDNTKLTTGSTSYFNNYGAVYGSQYGTDQVGFTQTNTITSTNISFDWNITSNLTLSLKGGHFELDTKQDPLDAVDNQSLDYTYYAANSPYAGNPFAVGGFGVYTQDEKDVTNQFNAALTWLSGSHTVKAGVGLLKSTYTLAQVGSGIGGYQFQISDTNAGQDLQGILFLNAPATVTGTYKSAYLQDTWEVVTGLKVLYGARWEGQMQTGYNGVQIFNFSKLSDGLQPRLGFTWDVNNDGKTKVSGALAKYFEHFPQRAAIRTWGQETYFAADYGVSGQEGGWTYDPTAPTHASNVPSQPISVTNYSTLFNQDPIAQGIKMPQRNEVTLGVDHTFDSGYTLGLHATYRKLTDAIEDSEILNPATAAPVSADGHAIWWNPGPSVTWTQTYVSSDSGHTYNVPNTGFPAAYNQYTAVTVNAEKKTSRDYFSFNLTWSRLKGNYEGVISSAGGLQADGNITASYDSYAYVGNGLLPLDRTYVGKLQYSHRFSFSAGDLNVGVNYSYQSGTPVSLFDDGSTTQGLAPGTLGAGNIKGDPLGYGNATPAFGQYGNYGRTPINQDTDLHLDFGIKTNWYGVKISPSADIFNLFNVRAATVVQQTATLQFSGASDIARWDQPTAWMEGRRIRFGVKATF